MIKYLILRIIRNRLRYTLPLVHKNIYIRFFNLSNKFFLFLKPSQLWVIVLALLNKMDYKNLISIPSLFILFNDLFLNEIQKDKISKSDLYNKLTEAKLIAPENKLEIFFWVLIIYAIIRRFIISFFKLLWIPLFFKDNCFNFLYLKIFWF